MKKLIVSVLLVIGCASNTWAGPMDDMFGITELKKQLSDISTELTWTQNKIKELTAKIENLELEKNIANWRLERIEKESYKISSEAYLRPTENRFSVVTSPTARYGVSVTNVKNYASGSKVTLEFINFYGVGVNGVKAELVATPITPDGTNYTEIEKLQRTTSDIVGDIPAGTAKRKTFNIAEIPAEKLKMLKVTITEEGVRYHKN